MTFKKQPTQSNTGVLTVPVFSTSVALEFITHKANMMRTPTIRKLLREAGLLLPSVLGNHYEDALVTMNAREIEIKAFDGGYSGDYDLADGAEELMEAVGNALASKYRLNGMRTGYGSWILGENVLVKGDWNDRSSAHHY